MYAINRTSVIQRHKLLLIIILFSLAARIGTALYIGNQVEALPGTFDQVSYHNLALRLVNGHGFTFGGPWSVVGAGTVVIQDMLSYTMVVGMPAKVYI